MELIIASKYATKMLDVMYECNKRGKSACKIGFLRIM